MVYCSLLFSHGVQSAREAYVHCTSLRKQVKPLNSYRVCFSFILFLKKFLFVCAWNKFNYLLPKNHQKLSFNKAIFRCPRFCHLGVYCSVMVYKAQVYASQSCFPKITFRQTFATIFSRKSCSSKIQV